MIDLIDEVFREQPFLTIVGAVNIGLAFIMLLGLAIDSRTILSINPWVKPLKFAISIAAYLLTMALFLSYFPASNRLYTWAGVTIALTMLLEIVLISTQALRGTTSHFNAGTPLDGAIFGLMGIAVAVNTLMLVVVLWQYFYDPPILAPSYLWGIRLGIIAFVLGSLQGMMMISNGAHTVGAADGGPGLPFLNWSTKFGDLRIAHFIGLHALQIIPFVGYLTNGSTTVDSNKSLTMISVFGVAGLVVGMMALAQLQAMSGRPLISVE